MKFAMNEVNSNNENKKINEKNGLSENKKLDEENGLSKNKKLDEESVLNKNKKPNEENMTFKNKENDKEVKLSENIGNEDEKLIKNKKIEIVTGKISNLNISPVYEHLSSGKPKIIENKPQNIVIPEGNKNNKKNE